ncbi:hypothetical protein [Microvirga pudoricolor]|uniref:hypothetical protein n=1 Tax=Microvirga pudoricolor TaxID=2778729 RepID=UPI00194DD05B|nr:hypothetical protein [Microvirga pudoricolor]MBM6593725.1 hypothetical protein [Microvirga pudoricolor]
MANAQEKKKPGKVVDLRPDVKRKQLLEPYRWDVTAEHLDRIAADLWPGLAKANEVRTVKGSLRKIPPLTREGREAVDKLHSAVANMTNCLQGLSEAALKGLVYEADHLAAAYAEGRPFWQAITTEAQKYKDIQTQHRTGKGPFVAVLRLWKEVDKYEVREVDTIAVRCKNKAAAIETARRLLAENAHRFDDGVSVEAEVLASLEWEAEPEKEVAET